MNFTLEKKEVTVEVTLTITAEEWAKACDTAFNRSKNKYSVPGFRKGYVPRKILENMYGKAFLYEDAIDACFPEYYGQAIESDKTVNVISGPELLDFKVNDDETVMIKAQAAIRPEIKLGAYTGLEIEKTDAKVSDDEFNAEINKTLDKYSRMVEVTDRAVENNDEVTIDYSGSVDGEKFEGGTAENQKLVIGSNRFIPGFEEQLIGMNIGDEKDINVKFPEEYHAENLKGKDSVFHIKLHKIEKKELPVLNDEFVKDISEFETVDAYKEDVKKKMEEDKAKRSEQADENNLLEAIVKNAEVPESQYLIEREMDYYLADFERMLNAQGLTFENYTKFTGQTRDMMRESNREKAINSVKSQLVIDAIIEKESLTANAEDTEVLVSKQAAQLSKSVEDFKKDMNPDMMSYFLRQATIDKFFAFIKEHNNFIEKN